MFRPFLIVFAACLIMPSRVVAQSFDVGGTPAGVAGHASDYTAGSGDAGFVWDNAPSSDVTMTERNDQSNWFIAPPDSTHTQKTRQNTMQSFTQPVGNRLIAPISILQFGDTKSFNDVYDLGFPAPRGVTFSQNAMYYNNPFPFGPGIPGVPIGMPTVGTGSVITDITRDGGY